MIAFLRKLFFLKRIYFKKTLSASLLDSLIVVLVAFICFNLLQDYPALVIAGSILLVFFTIRSLIRNTIVNRRIKLAVNDLPPDDLRSSIGLSGTNYELNNADYVKFLAVSEGWKMYDLVFDFYRRTKYGTYLSRQAYYTVFEAKLDRTVPHLIFDSNKAKGRQFRYLYLKSQRISLEGDFDRHFTTYAPNHYEVDTLSFITPEVMVVLKSADKYDIELVGDRLFLYAPLLDPSDFAELQTIGQRLKAGINDNLDNYMDSYLNNEQRRTSTLPFARKLLKSPFKPMLTLAGCLCVLVIIIYLGITVSPRAFFNEWAYFIYFMTASGLYKVITIVQDNRHAEETFTRALVYKDYLSKKKQ